MAKRKSKLEKLAYEIADLLKKYNSHIDVAIYFEDKRLSTYKDLEELYGTWQLEEGFKGSSYTEYANDETITMVFEGAFYHAMNYGDNTPLMDEFNKLVEKYGFYHEQGHAWSLSLFKV